MDENALIIRNLFLNNDQRPDGDPRHPGDEADPVKDRHRHKGHNEFPVSGSLHLEHEPVHHRSGVSRHPERESIGN